MTADTESGGSDPMQDADAWKALSHDEQSDVLDEGLADLRGEKGDGAWRHLDEREKAATVDAIERGDGCQPVPDRELSETERAMQAALEETWTADVFADLDDVPTVPFECRELDASEQQILKEAFGAMAQIEAQGEDLTEDELEDLDDLEDALNIDTEHFQSADDLEEWITWLLGDVTVDDAFDQERFQTGRGLRTNTRKLLFLEIFMRYHEESERAMKFRSER